MRIKIDKANDALYIRLDESDILESEEVQPGLILDFNAAGNVVGIEMLGVSGKIAAESLDSVLVETG